MIFCEVESLGDETLALDIVLDDSVPGNSFEVEPKLL